MDKNNPLSVQVDGDHYKNMPIQYVCRHRNKNGAMDIKKAIHYLQVLLELEYPDNTVLLVVKQGCKVQCAVCGRGLTDSIPPNPCCTVKTMRHTPV